MTQSTNLKTPAFILGLFIAAGLAGAGYLASEAILAVKQSQRFVTVKGLAETEVAADLAIWPISFKVGENDLGLLQKNIEQNRDTIRTFLLSKGFVESEISISPPMITDYEAENYSRSGRAFQFRYLGQATVLLRTQNVQLTRRAMAQSDELVKKGIALTGQDYGSRVEFLFTSLNKIKPAMIEEANKNARQAAVKFAQDSGSQVGSIRQARQGLFSIRDRDSSSADRKIVRVVTTVEYFLE